MIADGTGTGRGKSATALLLLLPGLALLTVVLAFPLASLVAGSFSGSAGPFTQYERIAGAPVYMLVLLRTVLISAATALLCLVLGFPVAYRLTQASGLAKAAILLCIFLSFWTNLLVRGFSWMVLLNPNGVISHALEMLGIGFSVKLLYNTAGVLIGQTQILLPYMILPIAAVMSRADRTHVRAARSLGASPVKAFFYVYIPSVKTGIQAGLVLVFTLSLGSFIVPALLGGPEDTFLAQLIEFSINSTLNLGFASALATLLLATTLIIYWVADRWFGLGQVWSAR